VLVQGLGARRIEQINGIVITARHGVPIRVSDVAEVVIGHRRFAGGGDCGRQRAKSSWAWASCSWARTRTKSLGDEGSLEEISRRCRKR